VIRPVTAALVTPWAPARLGEAAITPASTTRWTRSLCRDGIEQLRENWRAVAESREKIEERRRIGKK
jgi:hypothetical protein